MHEEVFERAFVLDERLYSAALGAEEGRLRDEDVAALDQLRHLTEEEREQQRADMGAVDVGVRHDDDLVIARFVRVEFIRPDAGAERHDQRADLLGRQHLVEARPLDIEDLAAQRQHRLEGAVARLLGTAAGRIALDQEQLGFGGIARNGVSSASWPAWSGSYSFAGAGAVVGVPVATAVPQVAAGFVAGTSALAAGGRLVCPVTVTGGGTYSYRWYLNGGLIQGATANPYIVESLTAANGGTLGASTQAATW